MVEKRYKIVDRYKCIRVCIVHGRRFRMGEELPMSMIPDGPDIPNWFKNHFEPEVSAEMTIRKERLKELGIDPGREKIMAAKLQGRADNYYNRMDLSGLDDEQEDEEEEAHEVDIDFRELSETTKHTKAIIAAELDRQFGIKIDKKKLPAISKIELIDMGADAALGSSQS